MLLHFTQEDSKLKIIQLTNKPHTSLSHQPQHMEATVESKHKETTTSNIRVTEIVITRDKTIIIPTTMAIKVVNNRATILTKYTKETIIMTKPATINLLHQCTTIRALIITTRTKVSITRDITTLNLSKQRLRLLINQRLVMHQAMVIMNNQLLRVHTILKLQLIIQSHQHHRLPSMLLLKLVTRQNLATMLPLQLALDPITSKMVLTKRSPTGKHLQTSVEI
jgi:hypothetical protein